MGTARGVECYEWRIAGRLHTVPGSLNGSAYMDKLADILVPSAHLVWFGKRYFTGWQWSVSQRKSWGNGRSRTTSAVWSGLHRVRISILLRISELAWREHRGTTPREMLENLNGQFMTTSMSLVGPAVNIWSRPCLPGSRRVYRLLKDIPATEYFVK